MAPERGLLTSRAGCSATAQVGRLGRTVSDVAWELGCDWHTMNKGVMRWGDALLEADTVRFGKWRGWTRRCSGGKGGGRRSSGACRWWMLAAVSCWTLCLVEQHKARPGGSEHSLPNGVQGSLAGAGHVRPLPGRLRPGTAPRSTSGRPFHVVGLANRRDCQDRSLPPEINRLGRTIARWATQIVNWHLSVVTNGPTEALNNLIKRIKRIKRTAFGFRNFAHYRIRTLLYAGKPNWKLLTTITPP